jgi:hypothetical protein
MEAWNTIQRIATQTLGYFVDPRGLPAVIKKIYAIGCTPNPNPAIENAALHVDVQNTALNPVNVTFPAQPPVVLPALFKNVPQAVLLPGFELYQGEIDVQPGGTTDSPTFTILTDTPFMLFLSNIGANSTDSIQYILSDHPTIFFAGLSIPIPAAPAVFVLAPGETVCYNRLDNTLDLESGKRHMLVGGSITWSLGSPNGTTVLYSLFLNKQTTEICYNSICDIVGPQPGS